MSRRSRSFPGTTGFAAVRGIVASDGEALGRIADRSARLAALKKALHPLIPRDLQPHCELANYRDSTLVFTATSPVWASRLRRSSAEILHSVHTELKIPAHSLDVRIVVQHDEEPASAEPRELSETARRSLEQAAAACPDTELQAAIRRMVASRGKRED